MTHARWLDLAIVAAYMIGMALVGLLFSRRQTNTETYFMANARSVLGHGPVDAGHADQQRHFRGSTGLVLCPGLVAAGAAGFWCWAC
jgi:hypothetical protein